MRKKSTVYRLRELSDEIKLLGRELHSDAAVEDFFPVLFNVADHVWAVANDLERALQERKGT